MRKIYLPVLASQKIKSKSLKLVAAAFIFLIAMVPMKGMATKCPSSNAITPNAPQTRCVGTGASTLTDAVTASGSGQGVTALFQWYYNTTNSNTIAGATAIAGA